MNKYECLLKKFNIIYVAVFNYCVFNCAMCPTVPVFNRRMFNFHVFNCHVLKYHGTNFSIQFFSSIQQKLENFRNCANMQSWQQLSKPDWQPCEMSIITCQWRPLRPLFVSWMFRERIAAFQNID